MRPNLVVHASMALAEPTGTQGRGVLLTKQRAFVGITVALYSTAAHALFQARPQANALSALDFYDSRLPFFAYSVPSSNMFRSCPLSFILLALRCHGDSCDCVSETILDLFIVIVPFICSSP